LAALSDHYSSYEDFCFVCFDTLSKETGLDRATVRRSCRFLTRRGLAQFSRGLWSEDGEPRGSGYAATRAGAAMTQVND
jgi:hypothetical protein